MVSLWPWRGNDTSPAAFEQALSALSTKISKTQVQLDKIRQRARRFAALWTLYTSFAYLLCVIILALVVGWKNWRVWEYGAIAGSPVIIYLIRTAITTYYVYRIDTVTSRLEEQQSERAKTIEKLKAATKYDSTQQLLEKYGGAPPQSSPKPKSQQNPAKVQRKNQKQPQRTGIGPPATANIPRNQPMGSPPATPQSISQNTNPNRFPPINLSPPTSIEQPGPPEFAPNAFGTVPQYDRSSEPSGEGNWYDRILDLLLGEDETSPKNRIVLICQHCRMVNGQAPPGVKRLEDLGRWKCFGCGGWNGEVDEGTKIVEKIKERVEAENQNPQGRAALKEDVDEQSETNLGEADEKLSEEESFEEIEAGHEVEANSDENSKVRRRKGPKV